MRFKPLLNAHTFARTASLPLFSLTFNFHQKVNCTVQQARNAYKNAYVKAHIVQTRPGFALRHYYVVPVGAKDVFVTPVAPCQSCQDHPSSHQAGPCAPGVDDTLCWPHQTAEFAKEKVRHQQLYIFSRINGVKEEHDAKPVVKNYWPVLIKLKVEREVQGAEEHQRNLVWLLRVCTKPPGEPYFCVQMFVNKKNCYQGY